MPIAFSRSMRSLNNDSFRPSVVGLTVSILLLAAWAAWFLLARITVYETGQIVTVAEDGAVTASFSSKAIGRIHQGQPALLRFDGASPGPAHPVRAIVTDVNSPTTGERNLVNLFALPSGTSVTPLQDNLTGKVDIEIDHLSPAALVVRASEQAIDARVASPDSQDR